MAIAIETCTFYKGGLCEFPFNPKKPDQKPSLATINLKARAQNYQGGLPSLKCTARINNGFGLSDQPDLTRQAACQVPARTK